MPAVGMPDEGRLENLLADDIDILGLGVMIIGRQVPTGPGGFIDLLGIDVEGSLYVIELKRNRTPRDVVAQVLDYASWVQELSYDDVKEVFDRNSRNQDVAFEQAYAARFDPAPDESLNENHRLVIVASELEHRQPDQRPDHRDPDVQSTCLPRPGHHVGVHHHGVEQAIEHRTEDRRRQSADAVAARAGAGEAPASRKPSSPARQVWSAAPSTRRRSRPGIIHRGHRSRRSGPPPPPTGDRR